jgi:hypothetical protein
VSDDELRTAALLLAGPEPPSRAACEHPAVRRRARARPVPPRPVRVLDRLRLPRGLAERSLEAAASAREAVLGQAAAGPPRVLLRVDEFPNVGAWRDEGALGTESFLRFHEILRGTGCAYMIAVLPRVPRESQNPDDRDDRPLNEAERAALRRMAGEEGMELAVHGHDHRSRDARPRHHSELIGLGEDELEAKLDASDAVLRDLGAEPRSFVPPFNRFTAAQYPALARRYEIVCAGPETVLQMGFQPTPQWRRGAAYVPSYAPLYGRARDVRPAVERLLERDVAVWAPVTLHWSWEAEDDYAELTRLAELVGPLTARWDELLSAAEAER